MGILAVKTSENSADEFTGPDGETAFFDVVDSRDETLEADIPDYPVEGGEHKQDHIQTHPESFSVTGTISKTPIRGSISSDNPPDLNRDERLYQRVKRIFKKAKRIKYVTKEKVYPSVGIKKIRRFGTNKGSITFSIDLKIISVSSPQTVQVSPEELAAAVRDSASPKAKKGKTPPQNPSDGTQKSIEKSLQQSKDAKKAVQNSKSDAEETEAKNKSLLTSGVDFFSGGG